MATSNDLWPPNMANLCQTWKMSVIPISKYYDYKKRQKRTHTRHRYIPCLPLSMNQRLVFPRSIYYACTHDWANTSVSSDRFTTGRMGKIQKNASILLEKHLKSAKSYLMANFAFDNCEYIPTCMCRLSTSEEKRLVSPNYICTHTHITITYTVFCEPLERNHKHLHKHRKIMMIWNM